MKILAVRGENLASLPAFDLDFAAPPLGDAGLFAITGPTGSGKSTILDAICLALYNATPRTAQADASVQAALLAREGDRISATDSRNLLRRGAAEGFAEVDFLDRDGIPWRSRWKVHRARRRATGRLQHPDMTLTRLDTGEIEASGRRSVVRRVAALLGLDFDQFRRAALLAQGEFAAFLRASADERAALLEALVPASEIYTRLSVAAHERRRDAAARLDEIRARAEAVEVLADEDRAAVEASATRLDHELEAARKAEATAAAELAWHEQAARLADDRDRAARALADTDRQRVEARVEARREHLATVQRAQRHRPVLDRADAARKAEADADAAARDAEARLRRASEALSAARRAKAEADEAHRAVTERLDARAAERDEALRLDQAIAEGRRGVDTLRADETRAAAALDETRSARDAAERALADLDARIAALRDWLDEHAWFEGIARSWDHWGHALARATEAASRIARLDAEREAVVEAAERAANRRAEADRAVQAAREAREARRRAWDEARAAAEAIPPDRAVEALAELQERRQRLEGLRALAREAADAARAAEKAADERDAARRQAQALSDRAASLATRLDELAPRLDEVATLVRETRDALSADDLRARLVDGRPCPVCGSPDHPWARAGAPDATALARLEGREQALRDECTRLERERAEATARAEAAAGAAEAAQAHHREHLDRLAELRRRWRDQAAPLPALAALGEGDDPAPVLASLLDGLAEDEARARARLDEARRLAAAAARAREAFEHADATLEAARRALDEAETAAQSVASRLREHDRDLQLATAAREEALGALAGPTRDALEAHRPDLAGVLASKPAEVLAALEGVHEAWKRREQALADLAGQRDSAVRQRDEAAARLPDLEARHAELARRRARAEGELAQARTRRAALLDGLSTAEWDARAAAERQAAEAARDAARERAELAAREHGRARQSADDAAARLTEARARVRAADEALAGVLAEEDYTEAHLRELLRRDAAWIEGETRALDALDAARLRAAERLRDREARLAEHLAAQRPERDAEATRHALEEARVQVRELHKALAEARARLTQDDRNRALRAERSAAVEAQEAELARWAALADLIGSYDGKRFRGFAQSLTFESLIAEANRHLDELAPRYRLMRVPDRELDFQVVDRDLGDDVRPVSTLSGGETFLVSLALALGLATLSSRGATVGSLFIDEGFGTLDQRALAQAIDTLEQLQATGRQVGIISHVDEIRGKVQALVRVERKGTGTSRVRVEAR